MSQVPIELSPPPPPPQRENGGGGGDCSIDPKFAPTTRTILEGCIESIDALIFNKLIL